MPLLWVSLFFLTGILLAANLPVGTKVWLSLAGISLAAYFLWRWLTRPVGHSRMPVPGFILLMLLCLGAARYRAAQPVLTPATLVWYNDLPVEATVEGVIVAPPDEGEQSVKLRLAVTQISFTQASAFIPVEGQLIAWLPRGDSWRYGDRVRLSGQLETPYESDDFSYKAYLASRGIYSTMFAYWGELLEHDQGNPILALIYGFRERALATVYRVFPDPEGALLAGILLGYEGGIPDNVQEAFIRTGTSHIIAISGFNACLVASFSSIRFQPPIRVLGDGKKSPYLLNDFWISCILEMIQALFDKSGIIIEESIFKFE